MHHFVGNNDKSCLMDANRKITVDASGEKEKTEKIADNCGEYIKTVRTGFASGNQAPYLFLERGKNLYRKTL